MNKLNQVLLSIVFLIVIVVGIQYVYETSFTESSPYTERKVTLSSSPETSSTLPRHVVDATIRENTLTGNICIMRIDHVHPPKIWRLPSNIDLYLGNQIVKVC